MMPTEETIRKDYCKLGLDPFRRDAFAEDIYFVLNTSILFPKWVYKKNSLRTAVAAHLDKVVDIIADDSKLKLELDLRHRRGEAVPRPIVEWLITKKIFAEDVWRERPGMIEVAEKILSKPFDQIPPLDFTFVSDSRMERAEAATELLIFCHVGKITNDFSLEPLPTSKGWSTKRPDFQVVWSNPNGQLARK